MGAKVAAFLVAGAFAFYVLYSALDVEGVRYALALLASLGAGFAAFKAVKG